MGNCPIELKNGIRVFTRMVDNIEAVTFGIVDIMKEFRPDYPIFDFIIPKIKRIMGSSSTNVVLKEDVFTDIDNAKKTVKRVVEIYIEIENTRERKMEGFLISFDAFAGSNEIGFGLGWESPYISWGTTNMDAFIAAMTAVVQKLVGDMDKLISDEQQKIQEMTYKNLIQNELNKTIDEYRKDNPKEVIITWDGGDTMIAPVECAIDVLTESPVSEYPVRKFTVSVKDSEGVPLYEVSSCVKDASSSSPDANSDIKVRCFNHNEDRFRKFVDVNELDMYYKDIKAERFLKDCLIPAIEKITPHLFTLQTTIISQTLEKLGKMAK